MTLLVVLAEAKETQLLADELDATEDASSAQKPLRNFCYDANTFLACDNLKHVNLNVTNPHS